MLDHATLLALDSRLAQFYSLLRWEASLETIADECETTLDNHAKRENDVGALVTDTWRDCWATHGWLASGRFTAAELSTVAADALHGLFTEMARFVMDPALRNRHKRQLRRTCREYLARRLGGPRAGR